MKMVASFAILASPLVAGLLIMSCHDTTLVTALPSSPSPLRPSATLSTNIVWTLKSLNETGSPTVTIANPDLFTLMLTDEGKVQARADCNRASASYTIANQTLSVGLLASTQAYCTSAPVDGQYLALLGGENVATVDGDTLQLTSRRGTLRFTR